MEKKLKISLDLDDKAFSAGIKRAIDQLSQIQRSPQTMQMQNQLDQRLKSMGYGGLPGAPGYDKMVTERKKTEKEKKEFIEDLLKSQSRLVKNEERLMNLKSTQLKAGKDITKTEKALVELSDQKIKNEGMLTAATEKRVRTYRELFTNMEKEFKMGGLGGIKQAWTGMSGVEKVGFGATSAGAIAGVVAQTMEYIARRPIDIAKMQGAATAGTVGLQLAQARTGEYTFESMYGEDRKRAAEKAEKARSGGKAADIMKLIAGIGLAAGTAALGIATGGIGLVGAGAIAGGLGFAGSSISKGILDPEKYKAYQAAQYSQDFTDVLQSEHEMNPLRKAAIDRLRDTSQRDIAMQRTLNLGDETYRGRGGYLQGQMNGNFTDQQVVAASQGILGAGGSTAMAKQSGTSLMAERGLGITNASQILGMLSGTQGVPESSKRSLIDIFSRGLDDSKYAEENRKFIQNVAQQVMVGGTTTEDAADKIAARMSSFITGTTTQRGVEAGKSAYEAFQGLSSSTTGYTGAINIATAISDPYLSKIKDPAALNSLLTMKDSEISEDDPTIRDAAKSAGLTPAQLANHLRQIKGSNVRKMLNRPEAFKSASAELSKYEAAHGGSSEGFKFSVGSGMGGIIGQLQQLRPDLDRASLNQMSTGLVQQMIDEMQPEDIKKDKETVSRKTATGRMEAQTGRAIDTSIQASSLNAQNSLDTLSSSISKFAQGALDAAKLLQGSMPNLNATQANIDRLQNEYNKTINNPKGDLDKAWKLKDELDAAKNKRQNIQEQAGIGQ